MLEHFQELLKAEGFEWVGFTNKDKEMWLPEKECRIGNWEMYFDIPNGEIVAVGILHVPTSGYWNKPTYPVFGYLDTEKIIDYVKKVIMQIESESLNSKLIAVNFRYEELESLEAALQDCILNGFAEDDSDPIITALSKIIEAKKS